MDSTNVTVDKQCSIENDVIFDNSNVPIRALYAKLKKSCHSVQKHFEKYGEIESVRIIGRHYFDKWLIRYKNADSARQVLLMPKHEIGNYSMEVEVADLYQQPDYRAYPPDQVSKSNILNALYDDAFYLVFGHLGILDLANVAEVCIRFKKLAIETYSTKYKGRVKFGIEYSERYEDIDVVLRNFGPKIETIEVEDRPLGVFDSTNKHCTSATSPLKEVRLSNIKFGRGDEEFCQIFAKLEKLRTIKCSFYRCKSLLAACTELKTLHIHLDKSLEHVNNTYPHLEEVSIVASFWKDKEFNRFVKVNPRLKKLRVMIMHDMRTENTIRAICENLPHLVELELDTFDLENSNTFESDIQNLKRLRFLKLLKLHDGQYTAIGLLKTLAENELPIKDLVLRCSEIDNEAIQRISQMKQITALRFVENFGNLTDAHVITLSKELPQLQEMWVGAVSEKLTINGIKKTLSYASKLRILKLFSYYGLTFKIDDYQTILMTIQSRPGKEKLLIEVDTFLWQEIEVNIPKGTLLANSNILCFRKRF